MKLWPFTRQLETRAGSDTSYTDALVAALVSRAQGKTLAIPSATAALEACSGTVGRAFMSCEVKARPALAESLTPTVLELIGRSLIRSGESVFLIDTTTGALRLLPAETWDITGSPMPDSWQYRITLGGPSLTQTYEDIPSRLRASLHVCA